jgi:hypothetical protein
MRLYPALMMFALVPLLGACGASGGATVLGIKGSVSDALMTAKGKTRVDQAKIDETAESGIRAGLWDRPK